MRRYLLLAVFLFVGNRAFAQAASSASRLDSALAASRGPAQALASAARAAVAPDTAAALHHLFAAKRQRRNLLAIGTVLFTGLSVAIASNTDANFSRNYGELRAATTVVFVVIPILVVDLVYHAQYSHKNERKALAAFEAHQLPGAVKSRLQPKYFYQMGPVN